MPTAVVLCLLAAPVPFPKGPWELTIRLDREAYYPREPIHAEVKLRNVSKRPLGRLRGLDYQEYYEAVPGRGTPIPIATGSSHCPPPPPYVYSWLGPNEAIRSARTVDHHYSPPKLAPGVYRLRAHASVFAWASVAGQLEPHVGKLASNEVTFRVLEPPATERETIAFLDDKRAENAQWRLWPHLRDHLEEIERTTKSGRFRVAAQLRNIDVGGLAYDGRFYEGGDIDASRERLRAVLASEYASGMMKGQASYHLALSHYDPKRPESGRRVEEMLRQVIDEHPDTFLASEAQRAIHALIRARRLTPAAP